MTIETQAEFAKRLGVAKSYVTALKHDGRLVLSDGGVDVEASLERIAATAGGRDDMAGKMADQRGAPVALPAQEEFNVRRVDAQARKEHLGAELLQIELDEKRGKLFQAQDVLATVTDAATTLRTRLESFPDVLAPQLAAVADEHQVRAILADNVEMLLQEMSNRFAHIGRSA